MSDRAGGRRLWSDRPAGVWRDGYPVGNGRLAALVVGGLGEERIHLNHEWLWRGRYRDRVAEGRAHLLGWVREAFFRGDWEEGTRRANEAFGGGGGVSGRPCRVGAYQPAGTLVLWWEGMDGEGYERELDLEEGVVRVRRGRSVEEVMAVMGGGPVGVRVSGWGRGWVGLEREVQEGVAVRVGAKGGMVRLEGRFEEGIGWEVRAVVRGGVCRGEGGRVWVEGEEVVVWVVVDVWEEVGGSRRRLPSYGPPEVPGEGWEAVRRRHVEAYGGLFGRVRLVVEGEEPLLPTGRRREDPDPLLPALLFDYGRYLLIASSAPGCDLPANLQGKWNPLLEPPWDADYHMDINLQMNYWLAEGAGLGECVRPLVRYVLRMVPSAREAARRLFGCRGIWFPLTSDAWARATPEAYGWDVWVGAAAWMAQHLVWRYLYGGDEGFLRETAYPFLKEVALFFEDFLVEDGEGVLQVVPSQSPEHRWEGLEGFPVGLCVSSAVDVQLVRWVLRMAVELGGRLGDELGRWREMEGRLARLRVGGDGVLLEWGRELPEAEPGHRHLSPLWGFFPGDVLWDEDPEVREGAVRLLERRVRHGCGQTGWSRAHLACLCAALGRAEEAWEHLRVLLGEFTTESLLGLHPVDLFQVDAGLGGAAAVLLMLLQVRPDGVLRLLPALPRAWGRGRVEGLRAPGGWCVGVWWEGGKVREAWFEGGRGVCRVEAWAEEGVVRHGGEEWVVRAREGVWEVGGRGEGRYAVRGCAGKDVSSFV
ncbi:glycosyl hydrolase family 95 catalytic domain-containing protein [Spirochaeta thermophila]|uniref:Alpha-L-fucosidase 2 n=1 Tax=Winmispira thermophila (strain ATCC 49972 / DSM 6192 / RI 19.B1) TaxID=665571 RepID=E0RPS6_WINT6|nr:glycoside hydrolase N-terminal domain-containing protein [Spirochaeta thermophila]ADN01390.1 alpha-L-fucosidase 2 precursor [Spirochaeta thermophila DSM 6192]